MFIPPRAGSGAVRIWSTPFPGWRSYTRHTKPGCSILCYLGQALVFACYVSGVCSVLFTCFGCRCHCNRLPGKTDLLNDLLYVESVVKSYTLTHQSTWLQYSLYSIEVKAILKAFCCHLYMEVT